MKRKSILITVALAAAWLGALPERGHAQVISLNVVGYYNVTLVPGWNLLTDQLVQTNHNANFVLFPPVEADGSLVYRFNPASQTYYEASTCIPGAGWYPPSGDLNDPVLQLPLGEGFFVWTPVAWVATFVGEVAQGTLSNPLPARYSIKHNSDHDGQQRHRDVFG